MIDIIGHRRIFLIISGIFVLASISVIAFFGLPLGIDFTGGSLLEVSYIANRPDVALLREEINKLEIGAFTLQPVDENGLLLRFPHVGEEMHQQILGTLAQHAQQNSDNINDVDALPLIERRFVTIGPTIGSELKSRAALALLFAIIGIVAYVAWAFRRVSRPIASWKYGTVAVIALIHDVTIPTGIFAVLGAFGIVSIDALFITALLTIMGFSVHDTIVVFDRTREHLKKHQYGSVPFAELVNKSVNETIARSVNTSLTTLLVLGALYIFGGESTKFFVLALMIGIVVGTYSSIFVASPLLVLWNDIKEKRSGSAI